MQEIEHEKLELYLCCRDLKNLDLLSKSDPQIRLYVKDNNEWSLLDQTEVIQDNLNPVFDTTFIINHCPQVERHLKFEVVDIDSETAFDIIGTAETTVTEILATKKHLLSLDLAHQGEKRRGELVVRAEKIKKSCHIVTLKIAGVGLANKDGYFGKSDPFLKLYKVRQGGDQLLVHETEVINDNLNPQWEEFRIKDYKLSEGNYDSHFKIECWDFQENGTHQYIGGCETTLNELKGGKTEYELHAFRETTKVGSLKIVHFSFEERKAFSDYIKNSDQLKTIFAIDFSKANNSSRNAAPLHTKSEHDLLNEYQKALQSVSQIMLSCSETTKVSVFGFGGKPQGSSGVSDCFPWGETAEATGVNGILDAYAHVLKNVDITGPTNFAPVISEAIKAAKAEKDADSGVYTILLLFTAGDIQDMEATTSLLAQAAHLPLSIIIIGLGNGDITKMKSLDSDKGLASKKGEKVVRDLVQFVSFKGFGGDMDYLSQRVFAEIPDQVVDYMNLVQKEAGATPKGFKSKGESVFDSAPTHNVNVGLLNE